MQSSRNRRSLFLVSYALGPLAADGADSEEIALEMGLPAQRVRAQLSRARARQVATDGVLVMIGVDHRLFRLKLWLIRTPITQRGAAYLKCRLGKPIYAGGSDQDFGNRLVVHAQLTRADYFCFSIQPDADRAYNMECALFNALRFHGH